MRTILSFHHARTMDARAQFGFTVAWASFIVARTPTPIVTTVIGIAVNNHKQDNFCKATGRALAGRRVFGMLYGLMASAAQDKLAEPKMALLPSRFQTQDQVNDLLAPIAEATGEALVTAFTMMVPPEALRVFTEKDLCRPTLDIDFDQVEQVEIVSDKWLVEKAMTASDGLGVLAASDLPLTELPQQAWWDRMNVEVLSLVNSLPFVQYEAFQVHEHDKAAGFDLFVHSDDEFTLDFIRDDDNGFEPEDDDDDVSLQDSGAY